MEVNIQMAIEIGLKKEEFEKIVKLLGRIPNFTELNLFLVMWSEHISYKSSIALLETLPRKDENLLCWPGNENAGVIDLGDDYVCVFKIQSSNHPTAINPYIGAISAIGGTNRDILAMGARPLVKYSAICLGNMQENKTKEQTREIIKGIQNYCIEYGIPVVEGSIFFNEIFNQNPIVNIISLGIVKRGNLISSNASEIGNSVYILGSATGKDGLKGAYYASINNDPHTQIEKFSERKSADPVKGKKMLEIIQEAIDSGIIVAMQDIDAGGIACAVAEMIVKGDVGMEIFLEQVQVDTPGYQPYVILLSETPDRMLVLVDKSKEESFESIANSKDLVFSKIGHTAKEGDLKIYYNGNLIVNIPPKFLVEDAPICEMDEKKPMFIRHAEKYNIHSVSEPSNLKEIAWELIKNPNISSKRWFEKQYNVLSKKDNSNKTDFTILNIGDSKRSIIVGVEWNSGYVEADPRRGTSMAVAGAIRKLICAGANPIAVTDSLNFGSPDQPEVFWQFKKAINGLSQACKAFNLPVAGGNVSFYNQSMLNGRQIHIQPTPVIAVLGILKDSSKKMTIGFKSKGDMIFMLGQSKDDISSSQYLQSYHKVHCSPAPHLDLDMEVKLKENIPELIEKELVRSAHSISKGGLFIALLEAGLELNLGFDVTTDAEIRADAFLFGESQGRILVSVSPEKEGEFIDFVVERKITTLMLGHVTKGEMRIDEVSFGFVPDAKIEYEKAIDNFLES